MGKVRKVLSAFGGAIALASILCVPAQASIVTGSFSFTASGFPAGAPVDPVTGHFSFTFDNTFNFFNVTTGLNVSLNIPGTAGPGMDYFPAFDILFIGDLVNDVNVIAGGTNDYLIRIDHVSTSPHIFDMMYTDVSNRLLIFRAGEVSITTPAPEPATLALLVLGLTGVAVTRRKHFQPTTTVHSIPSRTSRML